MAFSALPYSPVPSYQASRSKARRYRYFRAERVVFLVVAAWLFHRSRYIGLAWNTIDGHDDRLVAGGYVTWNSDVDLENAFDTAGHRSGVFDAGCREAADFHRDSPGYTYLHSVDRDQSSYAGRV